MSTQLNRVTIPADGSEQVEIGGLGIVWKIEGAEAGRRFPGVHPPLAHTPPPAPPHAALPVHGAAPARAAEPAPVPARFAAVPQWVEPTWGNRLKPKPGLHELCRGAGLRIVEETVFSRFYIGVAQKSEKG